MKNSQIIDTLKDSLTFEDILKYFKKDISSVKQRGDECTMRCPLGTHEDKKPSFGFNNAKKLYKCHACDGGGDTLSLISALSGYDIRRDFGIIMGIAADITGIKIENEEKIDIKKLYESAKPETNAAKKYKELKGLDISKLEIDWKAEPETEDILVPMRKPNLLGGIIGLQRGKKRFIMGSALGLFYEPKFIKNQNEIYLVEGLSDWLSMIASGRTNVIGLASATINTLKLATALKRFRNVNICLDLDVHKEGSDERGSLTGGKKTLEIAKQLHSRGVNCTIFALGADSKYDINDLWRKGGKKMVSEFFRDNQVSLSEFGNLVGLNPENKAYYIAKKYVKKYTVAASTLAKEFWVCPPENKVWKSVTQESMENDIMLFIENMGVEKHSSSLIRDVLSYIARLTAKRMMGIKDSLRSGGVYDFALDDHDKIFIAIKTGKYFVFREKNRYEKYHEDDYIYSTLEVDYRKETFSPEEKKVFDGFIKSIFEGDKDSEEKALFIQEWFGYTLLQKSNFQKILYILGKGGNGKSVLLNALSTIIGIQNFSNMELSEFAVNRFASSSLLGKNVNICTDLSKKSRIDNEMLKKISGGDIISAERKFKEPFQYRPYAKIIMASNNEPYTSDIGDWLVRRLQIIEFNNSFIGREDFSLEEKLEKCSNYIFWWAVEGLKRLLKRKRFKEPDSVRVKTAQYIESQNYVSGFEEFLKTQVSPGFKQETNAYKLYILFSGYMQDYEGRMKQFVPSRKKFVEEMIKAGYALKKNGGQPILEKETTCDMNDFEF